MQESCCMKSSTSSLAAIVGVMFVVCLTATGLGICLYFKKRVHRWENVTSYHVTSYHVSLQHISSYHVMLKSRDAWRHITWEKLLSSTFSYDLYLLTKFWAIKSYFLLRMLYCVFNLLAKITYLSKLYTWYFKLSIVLL